MSFNLNLNQVFVYSKIIIKIWKWISVECLSLTRVKFSSALKHKSLICLEHQSPTLYKMASSAKNPSWISVKTGKLIKKQNELPLLTRIIKSRQEAKRVRYHRIRMKSLHLIKMIKNERLNTWYRNLFRFDNAFVCKLNKNKISSCNIYLQTKL